MVECAFDLFELWKRLNEIDANKMAAKRYDKRPVRSRMESLNELCSATISKNHINAYESVSRLRNKLIHEPSVLCHDPLVAVDVYIVCQAISYEINRVMYGDFEDDILGHRKVFWRHRIQIFNDVMDFN